MTGTNQLPVVFIDGPRHPALQTLYNYWLAKRGARAMPARADISPADLKPLLPDIMIWGAVSPYPVRLAGDNIVRFVGRNNTGKPATEGMAPEASQGMTALMELVIQSKTPRFRLGKAYWTPEKSYRNFEACFLPLSADGETVDMVLGGMRFDVEV
jgi:hypothetical protein